MEDTVIGLDDLVKQIGEHLAETDETYRAVFADKIGASFSNDDDVLSAIDAVLSDPYTEGRDIVRFANELLTPAYKYDGDSLVTVIYPDDTPTLSI
jgi:hypothetical protein